MEGYVVKSSSSTNDDYGCDPFNRPIEEHITHGIINLDKTSGPTSHEIDSWVKRILHVNKTGHSGTLDPKVTGILPIGIGSATRVIQLLLLAPKEYVCLMKLHQEVDEDSIKSIFEKFTGKIFQTPPVKSAVKRELRARTIYYSDIYEIDGRDVLFRIGCESGTYVRTYCHNIGEALGCGAHMAELRRTMVGPLNEHTNLITLQDLTDAYYYYAEEGDETSLRNMIKPMEVATEHLPKVIIRDSAVGAICHGANLAAGGIVAISENVRYGDIVAIMTIKGELVASAKSLFSLDEILDSDSGIIFETNNVYMDPDVYPSMWK
ncbi:RNA-guided pseudouridylation complex pseudouridine synthase subunit Cbf5 [Methanobrevibacter acididurans]|uniref:RNA-guided pseudouridylation complex pseudouridine synthase subunit Cbf5 n=1 Tax=Methanobrevibacter TaxID=2172 RepID=UPI002A157DBB|nr:RNA-guided pseudouridylation complex pseudouridine synthase subunit Cbf5 [Methanobacteriaceae archaeon]